jgi:hypothetical protein
LQRNFVGAWGLFCRSSSERNPALSFEWLTASSGGGFLSRRMVSGLDNASAMTKGGLRAARDPVNQPCKPVGLRAGCHECQQPGQRPSVDSCRVPPSLMRRQPVPHATEMFSHPRTCPWAQRPLHLPAACFLTACIGFRWYSLCGVSVLAALGSVASGIVALRLLKRGKVFGELHNHATQRRGLSKPLPRVRCFPTGKS